MLHPHSGAFEVRYAGTAIAAGSNTHKKIPEIIEYYSVPQNTLSIDKKAARKQEAKHRQYATLQVQTLIVVGQKFSTRQTFFKKSHKFKVSIYFILKKD